jgi:hypothetical protein
LKKAKQNERELASKIFSRKWGAIGKTTRLNFCALFLQASRASQFDYDDLLCPFEKSKAKLDNLLLKAGTTFPRK